MDIEQIATVCHEANRAYCSTLGDSSQLPWNEAPDWQRESARSGVTFHVHELRSGREPLPSRSHESWLKEKAEAGWKYGAVKDTERKTHPAFLPYDQLPNEQKLKDFIFVGIVRAFWDLENMGAEKGMAQAAEF